MNKANVDCFPYPPTRSVRFPYNSAKAEAETVRKRETSVAPGTIDPSHHPLR